MPSNKCYSAREQIIDRLLRRECGVTVTEIMEAINEAFDLSGFPKVKAQNTILSDMDNIENRYGYDAQIERLRDPEDRRIIHYRYRNPNFSIYKVDLTPAEAECIRSAMNVLSRFQGMPQNSWISEMDMRLSNFLKNESAGRQVIGFDTIPQYTGNSHLRPLFEAIVREQTLTIHFTPLYDKVLEIEVWPYYLKQSGHTWHLIAAFTQNGELASIPLDSIISIAVSDTEYRPCGTDLDKFMSQRIGASYGDLDQEPVTVTFTAKPDAQSFLHAAPMHHTQRVVRTLEDGRAVMQIDVVRNVELLFELCKYGGHVTVLEPADLRHTIARMHAAALNDYGYDIDLHNLDRIVTDTDTKISLTSNITTMKVLTLIIKQSWFDQILSGEKTQEFREVKPTTIKRLLQLDEEGNELEDENGNSIPIEYDAIQFYVGYNKDRDSALVEVTDAYCEMFADDDGNLIWYEYDGKDWVAEQVVFNLGKVLEKNVHPKK